MFGHVFGMVTLQVKAWPIVLTSTAEYLRGLKIKIQIGIICMHWKSFKVGSLWNMQFFSTFFYKTFGPYTVAASRWHIAGEPSLPPLPPTCTFTPIVCIRLHSRCPQWLPVKPFVQEHESSAQLPPFMHRTLQDWTVGERTERREREIVGGWWAGIRNGKGTKKDKCKQDALQKI